MAEARIHDPRSVPVIGTDAHLPPVPLERLRADSLVQRFAARSDWVPEFGGDGARFPELAERAVRPASVLVPLLRRGDALQVLLTRRTDHLYDHAGQISFPGGRADEGDADVIATALREAEEEVGLQPADVQVLGTLPLYRTVTAYEVTPVVALVDPGAPLRLDAFEVAEAFEVPLAFLMNPAHHQRHLYESESVRRQFLSMPWQGVDAAGQSREYFIWGATAAMLRNLYRFLSA